jgi:hypothetical protein
VRTFVPYDPEHGDEKDVVRFLGQARADKRRWNEVVRASKVSDPATIYPSFASATEAPSFRFAGRPPATIGAS